VARELALRLADVAIPISDGLNARAAFARTLVLAANGAYGPIAALAAFREFADRLDGRPKQATETRRQRVTIMYRRGDPPPWLPKEHGDKPALWLSNLTHQEDPWINARRGLAPGEKGEREITHAAMAEYYGSLT
jgi:hypothetical protein